MSRSSTLAHLFHTSPQPTPTETDMVADAVMDYVVGLINREDLVARELGQLREAKKKTFDYRVNDYIRLYYFFETFIVTHKPFDVRQTFTREELRTSVARVFDLSKIPLAFRLIFLSEFMRTLSLLSLVAAKLSDELSTTLGWSRLAHVFSVVRFPEGLNVPNQNERLGSDSFITAIARESREVISHFFHDLFVAFYQEIIRAVGVEVSQRAFLRLLEQEKTLYDFELTESLLAVMPHEISDVVKLKYIGRDELEQYVSRRTKELEEMRSTLEEKLSIIESQNTTLESTKAAMLNLLDDAKKLEDQLKAEKANVEARVVERTRELRNQQARLIASIENLARAFVLTDTERNILLTNRKVDSIFGKNLRPWTLEDLQERLTGVYDVLAAYSLCIREKKTIESHDLQFVTHFLDIVLTPIFVDREKTEVIGALFLIKDMTETKVLQRSRDEFFSIASHELRTPLTAIRGNAAMVRDFYGDKLPDREAREMIDDIHESSVRLIMIVNDFLDVSRLELGKIQYKNEAIDVHELVESVLKDLLGTAQEKHISLSYEKPPEELPKVFADRDRTKQVLINLAGNSIKFTEKGGVTIGAASEDGFVRIMVTDTGRGIPYKNQPLLFRKFQQAGDSLHTRDSTKGTGLGLYISKLLTEGMGGTIGLDKSNEGTGSTFSFTLPVAK